jgi:hypothetical protein
MNKILLCLCMVVTTCNAADKQPKVTIVSCYSSMSSKKQRHEISLSDGTCVILQTSVNEPQDIKVTVSRKKPLEAKR